MEKDDVVYIHNGILIIKKNDILPFAKMWMELVCIMLSEIWQRQIPYYLTDMWNLRNKTDEGHLGGSVG